MESVQQLFEAALAHDQMGQAAEAEKLCQQILTVQPQHAAANHLLGLVYCKAGEYDRALPLIIQAIQLRPASALYHEHLGAVLLAKGQFSEAIAACRRAIELKSGSVGTYCNLGLALINAGRVEEAVPILQTATRMAPNLYAAWMKLAWAYSRLGQMDEASDALKEAVRLQPQSAEAWDAWGILLADMGELDMAIERLERALDLEPGLAQARSALIFYMMFHPKFTTRDLQDALARWSAIHAVPLSKARPAFANTPTHARRIRIGYVSPDFRDHIIARMVIPLLENHDKTEFEVIGYSNVLVEDAFTSRCREACHLWRDISQLTDEHAAALIRQDQIDIRVDLAMHMDRNRLGLFAMKPAPIQVTFGAYPGSTGLSAIDYRLSDPYLDPPTAGDPPWVESTVRLPHTFWCFDPLDIDIPVNAPDLSGRTFTFGALNNFIKVNPEVLELWTQVLGRVPNSRILINCPEGRLRSRTQRYFDERGIREERTEFLPHRRRSVYLATYQRIDVTLDTFPYNGHATSLDSLWMGVPVVTLLGETIVGRAGLSQLSNLGLTELVARNHQQYVEIACALANDRPRLAALRATLREKMRNSPLMDAASFAQGVESVYRQCWRRWCDRLNK